MDHRLECLNSISQSYAILEHWELWRWIDKAWWIRCIRQALIPYIEYICTILRPFLHSVSMNLHLNKYAPEWGNSPADPKPPSLTQSKYQLSVVWAPHSSPQYLLAMKIAGQSVALTAAQRAKAAGDNPSCPNVTPIMIDEASWEIIYNDEYNSMPE